MDMSVQHGSKKCGSKKVCVGEGKTVGNRISVSLDRITDKETLRNQKEGLAYSLAVWLDNMAAMNELLCPMSKISSGIMVDKRALVAAGRAILEDFYVWIDQVCDETELTDLVISTRRDLSEEMKE